jgi:hypothetical protein
MGTTTESTEEFEPRAGLRQVVVPQLPPWSLVPGSLSSLMGSRRPASLSVEAQDGPRLLVPDPEFPDCGYY